MASSQRRFSSFADTTYRGLDQINLHFSADKLPTDGKNAQGNSVPTYMIVDVKIINDVNDGERSFTYVKMEFTMPNDNNTYQTMCL